MAVKKYLPDLNRFSLVTALSTLMLGLTYALPPSSSGNTANILGINFSFEVNLFSLFPLLIAIIALIGALWVLRSHPHLQEERRSTWQLLPNGVLPALSLFILAFTLREMARSNVWWVVYVLGSAFFGLVLAAEYNVLDFRYELHPIASLGLIGLSHSLFLILAVVLRTCRMRLYVILPLILLAAAFISVRTINLRTQGAWEPDCALLIAILWAQLAVGLQYFFLNPMQYGLVLTAALYLLISTACAIIQKLKLREFVVEPVLMCLLCVSLLLLIGRL